MADCYDYGSSHGCDDECPYLWDGKCDVAEEVIEDCLLISDEDKKELRIIYGLDEEEPDFKSIW